VGNGVNYTPKITFISANRNILRQTLPTDASVTVGADLDRQCGEVVELEGWRIYAYNAG